MLSPRKIGDIIVFHIGNRSYLTVAKPMTLACCKLSTSPVADICQCCMFSGRQRRHAALPTVHLRHQQRRRSIRFPASVFCVVSTKCWKKQLPSTTFYIGHLNVTLNKTVPAIFEKAMTTPESLQCSLLPVGNSQHKLNRLQLHGARADARSRSRCPPTH
jgi:hypothetical protein